MKAILTIDDSVGSIFPQSGQEGKTFAEVISVVSANLTSKLKTQPFADRVILAGNEKEGFIEINRLSHRGLLPHYSGTPYFYGNQNTTFGVILAGYEGDHLLVAASSKEVAELCDSQLKSLGYSIQRV